ncbi:MAG TPA: glycoside hydrolase family 15 protein [Candidatus Acidoferrum sp.]|nr:glycoside hydrolase family 15 protein [Candidatus Acidoferrum sp.]
MTRLIEDHAFVGDGRSSALIARDGAVDWMCAPRFDSPPFFAALLGNDDNGVWRLAPSAPSRCRKRRYAGAGLILETELETEGGVVRLVDFMVRADGAPRLARIVEGVCGSVPMSSEILIRPDFGTFLPRIEVLDDGGVRCHGGGDAVTIYANVPLAAGEAMIASFFPLRRGDCAWFTLAWHASNDPSPPPFDVDEARTATDGEAAQWAARLCLPPYRQHVVARSATILRNLVYAPTGAVCAAPTTSLPERIGGSLNWDYRFGWIRDTAFAVWAFLQVGAVEEAAHALEWILHASAGRPEAVQAAYSLDGYRRITETTVDELSGYCGSLPVRTGNAAATQVQVDVYGEIVLSAIRVEEAGRPLNGEHWRAVTTIADAMHDLWRRFGHGFWEVRGNPEAHVTGGTLACAGLRAMTRGAERRGDHGRADRYARVAREVERAIRSDFVDQRNGTIVTTRSSKRAGATSLWPILLGVIPPDDPVTRATIRAVERELVRDGLVYRTKHDFRGHGGAPREGAFLPCTGWLARAHAICGDLEAARRTYERFVSTANDAGIFSEEYDTSTNRMLGNVPQAFTHAEAILASTVLAAAGLRD